MTPPCPHGIVTGQCTDCLAATLTTETQILATLAAPFPRATPTRYTVYLLLSMYHGPARGYTRKSTTYTSDTIPELTIVRESPGVFDVGIRDNTTGHWLDW